MNNHFKIRLFFGANQFAMLAASRNQEAAMFIIKERSVVGVVAVIVLLALSALWNSGSIGPGA
jgi:hypothetical protein